MTKHSGKPADAICLTCAGKLALASSKVGLFKAQSMIGSINITKNLSEVQVLRPTESEYQRVEPSNLSLSNHPRRF